MKRTKLTTERRNAIEDGVRNAVETVVVDKALSRDQAFRMLSEFVSDGLACAGLCDKVTAADLEYAKSYFPI